MTRGRPSKGNRQNINLPLPVDLLAWVDAKAKAEGVTRPDLIAYILCRDKNPPLLCVDADRFVELETLRTEPAPFKGISRTRQESGAKAGAVMRVTDIIKGFDPVTGEPIFK